MVKFNNGRVTTSVLLYDRGVPRTAAGFGTIVAMNFEMLRRTLRATKAAQSAVRGRPRLQPL
jgi:hypothetical protein